MRGGRRPCLGGRLEGEPVLRGGEDVFDGALAVGPERRGARARRVEPGGAVAATQAHQAEAGAIALLGVRPAAEDLGDELPGGGPSLFCPADEPRRRPLGMRPVRAGHVLGLRRRRAVVPAAVRGDPPAREVDLDRRRRRPRLDALMDQLVGHAVELAGDLDVVIDVHPTGLPFGKDIAAGGRAGHRTHAG